MTKLCTHEWRVVGNADWMLDDNIGFDCICSHCGKSNKMIYAHMGMYEEVYGVEW